MDIGNAKSLIYFLALAGLPVADPAPGAPCFNGADPRLPPGMCDSPLESASSGPQAKKGDKKKRKEKRKTADSEGEGSVNWGIIVFGVLGGLAVLAPWGLKWLQGVWEEWQLDRAARQAQQPQQPRSTAIFKGRGRFAR